MKLKSKLLIALLFLLYNNVISQSHFSKEEVMLDLEYLKTSLEDTHINLYAYISNLLMFNSVKTVK